MLEGNSGFAIYVSLKLGGYIGCSYLGVRWLGRAARPAMSGVLLGVGRLVIGWLTGAVVAPLAVVAVTTDHVPTFYFTVLAIVRWFEWGVIQSLIPAAPGSAAAFVTGGTPRGRLWRAIGVIVSYLADAPFLLAEGFPRGRIFC